MDNAITKFLDAIIPNLEKLLSDLRFWIGVAMMVGPIILILLGVFYAFISPKEANHRLGYRTYFGMGSVAAWRFTQKLAGYVWGGMGIILTVVALIGVSNLPGMTTKSMADALWIMMTEAIGAALAWLGVEITVLIRYDINGSLRRKKKKTGHSAPAHKER